MALIGLPFSRLGLDPCGGIDEGGEEEPYNELKVDVDFVFGVPPE